MGRTMNEEREFADREWWRSAGPLLPSDVVDRINRVYFELDAERAHSAKLAERVAELEQMYAEMKDAADKGSKSVFALAAEQAENARLREVLDRLRDLAEIGLPMKANLVYTITNAALAQSPPSNAALRQVCAQMGTEAVTAYIGGASEKAAVDKALEGVLGPEVAR